ncbi:MAG: hypothetical protein MUC49_21345 [Raineya sp.]|jgi:hypothetical protein|nr:hypothetical protein [Raineya sp.]
MRIETLTIIHNQLINDEVDYSEAFDKIKNMPQVWSTVEWKKKRAELLKDYCENCGIKTGPFVLQHTKQPETFKIIYEGVTKCLISEIYPNGLDFLEKETDEMLEDMLIKNSEKRNACPTCRTVNIRDRKSLTPKYICKNNHEFDFPVELTYYSKSQTTDIEIARNKTRVIAESVVFTRFIKEFKRLHDKKIGKLSLLICIKNSIEYLEMTFTKTTCKSCAYKEDFHHAFKKQIKAMFN